MKPMKVVVKVTLMVDPEVWSDTYGCPRNEVRENVKDYVGNSIDITQLQAEELATDLNWS